MAKTELGTKRIDPETGRKFYDLNKDPIVSPYTGKTYPRSYFEESKVAAIEEEEEVEAKEVDAEEEEGVEVVSLEEADDDDEEAGGEERAESISCSSAARNKFSCGTNHVADKQQRELT